jgi:hypothetical protein
MARVTCNNPPVNLPFVKAVMAATPPFPTGAAGISAGRLPWIWLPSWTAGAGSPAPPRVALTLILQHIGGILSLMCSALQIGRVTVGWNARMEMMRLGVRRAGKQRSSPVHLPMRLPMSACRWARGNRPQMNAPTIQSTEFPSDPYIRAGASDA